MKRKLRIAQIAPVAESVPPTLYGGTERVVSWLTEELVRQGHSVTLFASGDSSTGAELVPICRKATRLDPTCTEPTFFFPLLAEELLKRMHEFDVIHGHVDGILFPALRRIPTPSVHTLHGRLDIEEAFRLYGEFSEIPLVAISNSQRSQLPGVNWKGTVYHGMPVNSYLPNYHPSDYFLFLGRMSSEKAPDVAIKLARRAGARLVMAAKVDKNDEEFFESVVKPLLKDGSAEFLGEVCEREKAALLSGARALLFPIRWPEPFGLVMIESLACGTPVITTTYGSAPEIIEQAKTGYCCNSEDELLAAIHSIDAIDRRVCRVSFEERFTDIRMTNQYMRIYEELCQSDEKLARLAKPVTAYKKLRSDGTSNLRGAGQF
jgi:glycosyltransferase involved in cell wall biosynthesis